MTERDAEHTEAIVQEAAQPAASPFDYDDALRRIAARLRAGRDHKRLTIEDVAARLKVAPSKLRAVESGESGALPDTTFTKGLIRAYARVLQIDIDDQLTRFGSCAPAVNIGLRPEGGLGEIFFDAPSLAARRHLRRRLIGALAAVVVVVLAGVGQFTQLRQWLADDAPATMQTAVVEPAAVASGMTQPLAIPASAVAPVAPRLPAPRPLAGQGVRAASTAASAARPAAAVPAQAPAPAPPAQAPAASDATALSMRFSGASWYEIKDESGKLLATGLATAGDTKTLRGTAPFKVVFGNADAIESLSVDGAPVDIRANANSRVARATLP